MPPRRALAAQRYLAGYLIEESLSIDNLFVFTAYRLIRSRGVQVDPEANPLVRITRRVFPVDVDYQGNAFTVRKAGRRTLTPPAESDA
jgi:hypothetical protein